jgi:putative sugar O-methyltransferase
MIEKLKKLYQRLFPKRFHNYYKKIRNNKNLDKDLVYISDIFINSESYKTVSNFWHLLNIIDYENILNMGLKNLGKNTFSHYYNFYDYKEEYLTNLFNNLNKDEFFDFKSNIFKTSQYLNLKETCNYNYLLLLLYFNLKKNKYFQYLKLLNDNTYLNYGNHYITIDNYNITSDKIISLFDLESIDNFSFVKNDKILEIGAGSGRLSECMLTIKNISNYTICDIPPAIFISYKRLKLAFPNKKIELLIDIDNPDELNNKIINNDVTFIFPHQIKKIKKKLFDLTVAIDCLHEMNKSTIKFLFFNINNISHKLYFSIWNKTKNWYSGNLFKKTERLDFEKGDYPIPINWQIEKKEKLKFPSNHLGIGYNLKD